MRIAAYLRVSTDTQAEHGLGLDVQRQAIRAWARAHGHKITSWHADAGVSGSNGLDSREALPEAMAEVRSGRATGPPGHDPGRGRGEPRARDEQADDDEREAPRPSPRRLGALLGPLGLLAGEQGP